MDEPVTLDATGLKCPLPVLKARKALGAMQPEQILVVLADDPAGHVDFPHFCAEQGHILVSSDAGDGSVTEYVIKKGR